jgi:hypothetical protein
VKLTPATVPTHLLQLKGLSLLHQSPGSWQQGKAGSENYHRPVKKARKFYIIYIVEVVDWFEIVKENFSFPTSPWTVCREHNRRRQTLSGTYQDERQD